MGSAGGAKVAPAESISPGTTCRTESRPVAGSLAAGSCRLADGAKGPNTNRAKPAHMSPSLSGTYQIGPTNLFVLVIQTQAAVQGLAQFAGGMLLTGPLGYYQPLAIHLLGLILAAKLL